MEERREDDAAAGAGGLLGVRRTDRQVGNAVAIDVAEPGHRRAEVVAGRDRLGEGGAGEPGELLAVANRAIGVQEEHPHGAGVRGEAVVPRCAQGDVHDAVAVDVTEGGSRGAEAVPGEERAVEATRPGADLDRLLHRAARVQQQHPRRAAAVVVLGADQQVPDVVAVQVAQARETRAEQVSRRQRLREAALAVADGRRALHAAVAVEADQAHRAGAGLGAHGDVGNHVAVDVADGLDAGPEELVRHERQLAVVDVEERHHRAIGVHAQDPHRPVVDVRAAE